MADFRHTEHADPRSIMRSILQRIATGPELSKDVSLEDARAGMRAVLEGQVDPVQAGVFLIALRMKRETDDECKGVMAAILDATHMVTAPVDEVFHVVDPYDGFNRTLPPAPFLPPLLAAFGVASISQGVERMGPKYGITHRQVLRAAGQPVDLTPEAAAERLGDPDTGWSYVDQAIFCPKLHALATLRTLIVKRPAIPTVEVMTGPVRGRQKTRLLTGFVHKPYPRLYTLLARHAGFDSALVVRGVEGGVIPSLRQAGKIFYYHDKGEVKSLDIKPAELDIEQEVRAAPLPEAFTREIKADRINGSVDATAAAEAAAQAGLEALDGKPGPTRDALVYSAALCLWHLGRHNTLRTSADAVRAMLDSGAVLARLQQAV
jgi:anthranilate phosphoribosyltransferase